MNAIAMRDIDILLDLICKMYPDIRHRQLQVTHPGDDDGLWYIYVPGRDETLQIETPNGNCPMLIESDAGDRLTVSCVADAFVEIQRIIRSPA